jgi:hypothetical protein
MLFAECHLQIQQQAFTSRKQTAEETTRENDSLKCTCGAEAALQIPLWRIPGLQALNCYLTPHLPLVTPKGSQNHIQE